MRHRNVRLISSINVTGLLAVLFVLLFAYMYGVYGIPYHGGVSVDLPKATHWTKAPRANREDAIKIAVTREGRLFHGSDQIRPSSLPPRIREQVLQGSPPKAYISADARARYGSVLDVLRNVRLGGVQDVTFLVEERKR